MKIQLFSVVTACLMTTTYVSAFTRGAETNRASIPVVAGRSYMLPNGTIRSVKATLSISYNDGTSIKVPALVNTPCRVISK